MKPYKAIFDAVESTLFEVGSRLVSREQILAELEPYKHVAGKRFTDDECYTMLVHIVFYSGFKAQTVTDKLPIIDGHFPDYRVVADYDEQTVNFILSDPQMIRHKGKIAACIHNAKTFREIVGKHGSFQAWLDSFPATNFDEAIRKEYQNLFEFLGPRTSFHFMTDLGFPVLKPDRVIERIFKRLALVENTLANESLYLSLIQEGRKFAEATGHPIRYIDVVFVIYGQDQTKEVGLEHGICLDKRPSCSLCGVAEYCSYSATNDAGSTQLRCVPSKMRTTETDVKMHGDNTELMRS